MPEIGWTRGGVGYRQVAADGGAASDIAGGRAHLDRASALYDPAEDRPLANRFGTDVRVASLCFRSIAVWLLGYPDAALVDADHALKHAREIGEAATLMYALTGTLLTLLHCENYATATSQFAELVALTEEKGASFWKNLAMGPQGCVLALTDKASDAIHMITASRSTGSTLWLPASLSHLAKAYAELGEFDDARRCIGEAMTAIETTNERMWEADVHRIAGEMALMSPEPDAVKAQAYFKRALSVARLQHAKSWELRAAMSMARLWRSQGKVQEAGELLAPMYGWFTEGFDTRGLKEAKALLGELAS